MVVPAEIYIATAAMLCLKNCFLKEDELVPSGIADCCKLCVWTEDEVKLFWRLW